MRNIGLKSGIVLGVASTLVSGQSGVALPTGGVVQSGGATFSYPNADTLRVNQSTNRAIIDWTTFSISPNKWVDFQQPSGSAAVLNRVVGSLPSSIAGKLTANGFVFLVNPNGIAFLPGAIVNVNGLIASTLDISNSKFLQGGALNTITGNYYPFEFERPSHASARGITVADGANITINRGGIAAFISPGIQQSGMIGGEVTRVALLSGDRVSLSVGKLAINPFGDGLLSFSVSPTAATHIVDIHGNPLSKYIDHTGRIHAPGGMVALAASSVQHIVENVIHTGGILEAKTYQDIPGGIVLLASEQTKQEATGILKANQVQILGAENRVSGQITDADTIYIGEQNFGFMGGRLRWDNMPTKNRETWVTPSANLEANEGIILGSKLVTFFGGQATSPLMEIRSNGLPTLGAGWSERTNVNELKIRRYGTGSLSVFPGDIIIQGGSDFYNQSTANLQSGSPLFAKDISAFLENQGNLTISNQNGDGQGFIYVRGDTEINWSTPHTLTLEAEQGIGIEWGAKFISTFAGDSFDAIVLKGNPEGTGIGNFNAIEAGLNNNLGSKIETGNFSSFYGSDILFSTVSGNIIISGQTNSEADNANKAVALYRTTINTESGNVSISGTNKANVWGSEAVDIALGSINIGQGNLVIKGEVSEGFWGHTDALSLDSNPIDVTQGSVYLEGIGSAGSLKVIDIWLSPILVGDGNLDIVGRNGRNVIHIFGTGSSDIWVNNGNISIVGKTAEMGQPSGIDVVLLTHVGITQNMGNLTIRGEVTDIDTGQFGSYQFLDTFNVGGAGVTLGNTFINQGIGRAEITGVGLTGISYYGDSQIVQGEGGIIVSGTGYGSWGGIAPPSFEGSSSLRIFGVTASDIFLRGDNLNTDKGIDTHSYNLISAQTGSGGVHLESNKGVYATDLHLSSLSGDVSVEVKGDLKGNTVSFMSSAGNVSVEAKRLLINTDTDFPLYDGVFIGTGAGDVSIRTDEYTVLPGNVTTPGVVGTGTLHLQGLSGTDIRINLASPGGDLNFDSDEWGSIDSSFARIIIGSDTGTNNIYLGDVFRNQDIKLWNTSSINNEIIFEEPFRAKGLTITTDGRVAQASGGGIDAESIVFEGNGGIELSTAANAAIRIRGEAQDFDFQNQSDLIVEGLNVQEGLKIGIGVGVLEFTGGVTGQRVSLASGGSILQDENGGINSNELEIQAVQDVDLHRGVNTVGTLGGEIGGGFVFKNTGTTTVNDLKTENGDIILRGERYEINEGIRAGIDGDKNLVIVADGVEQEVGSRIWAKGLGLRGGQFSLLGENDISIVAADTNEAFNISSNQTLTVGVVRGEVAAIPVQETVTGVRTNNQDVFIKSEGYLFIEERVDVGGGHATVHGRRGILQGIHGNVTANELEIFSEGATDLSHGVNQVNALGGVVGTGGFIFKSSAASTRIKGISGDGDVILSGNDFEIKNDIDLGNKNIVIEGGSIEQTSGTVIRAEGLGLRLSGDAELSGAVDRIAVVADGIVSYNNSKDLTIGTVRANVDAVTPTDTADERIVDQWSSSAAEIDVEGIATIDTDITVANNLGLRVSGGAWQKPGRRIRTERLSLGGGGNADLGQPSNEINELTGIFAGNIVIFSNTEMDIGDLTVNGDAILGSNSRLELTGTIRVDSDLVMMSPQISQGLGSSLTGSGLGLIIQDSDSDTALRGSFETIAFSGGRNLSYTNDGTAAVGRVEAFVPRVTVDDEDDIAIVAGINAGKLVSEAGDVELSIDGNLIGEADLVGDTINIQTSQGIFYDTIAPSGFIIGNRLTVRGTGNNELATDVNEIEVDIEGGILIKNKTVGGNDLDNGVLRINGLKTQGFDLIVAAWEDRLGIEGDIKGRNIVLDARSITQQAGTTIVGDGVGVRTSSDGVSLKTKTGLVAVEALGGEVSIDNDSAILEVGQVSAVVDAVTPLDISNEATVNGIYAQGDAMVKQTGVILQSKNIEVAAGHTVDLTGEDGIWQMDGTIKADGLTVAGRIVDLGQGNEINVFSGEADLGLFVVNSRDLVIGQVRGRSGIKVRDGDAIVDADGDIHVQEDIQIGNNIVLTSTGNVTANSGEEIEGNGLGIKAKGFVDFLGRFIVTAIEAEGDVQYKNRDDFTIGRVEAVVPPVVAGDEIDQRVVNQMQGRAGNIQGDGTIKINAPVEFTDTLNLSGDAGIWQMPGDSAIRASGLSLKGSGPIDLQNSKNSLNTLAVSIDGDTEDAGLVFYNSKGFTVGVVNGIDGIRTNNSNVILEADGDIILAEGVDTGTGNLYLGANGNVVQDGEIRARGLAVFVSGFVDLRNSDNEFDVLAVESGQGVTISESNGYRIGRVESDIKAVVPEDTRDVRELAGVRSDRDFISRTSQLFIDEDIDVTGNTTLVADAIEVNGGRIRSQGLGIQGAGAQSDYRFGDIDHELQIIAWETEERPQIRTVNPVIEQDVTSHVNTDLITTTVPSSPPTDPPLDDPADNLPLVDNSLENNLSVDDKTTALTGLCIYDVETNTEMNLQKACKILTPNSGEDEGKDTVDISTELSFTSSLLPDFDAIQKQPKDLLSTGLQGSFKKIAFRVFSFLSGNKVAD